MKKNSSNLYVKLCVGVLIIMIYSSQNIATEQTALSTKIVNPDSLFNPAPYGFSHVVVTKAAHHIAYISGQGGEDQHGHLADDFAIQVRQAYSNLVTAMTAAGASSQHVTKLTTYVVNYDPSKLEIMTQELKAVFGNHLPAQTLVPVPRLALDGMLFEVDAIAVLE